MIDLKPFCCDNDIRYYLNEPFSKGEYTYATNGDIVVRVSRRDDVPEIEQAPNCEKIFAEHPFVAAVSIPHAPPLIEGDCDCCNGEGTHERKCGNSAGYDCANCNATGKVMKESLPGFSPPIAVGDSAFAPRYLRLLNTLPKIQLSPNGQKAAPFTFDGGCGLLMPMRKRK